MSARSVRPMSSPRAERGVVMFIALIVMVALSLAAVALIRSVDTTTTVIGNLAFRQASIVPANFAIEKAAANLFPDANPTATDEIGDKTTDNLAKNYFASLQDPSAAPNDVNRAIPAQLRTTDAYDTSGLPLRDVDGAGNEIRFVIERVCRDPGPATLSNCDKVPPDQAPGTTVNDPSAPTIPPQILYRVTVRVDGPRGTNATSFVQAMLR